MASTEQAILEEQREILDEVKEIKDEVKSPSVAGRLFLGSLAGAVVGVTWMHRSSVPGLVAGLGKRLVSRSP
jgi:uncharacterized membrane protein